MVISCSSITVGFCLQPVQYSNLKSGSRKSHLWLNCYFKKTINRPHAQRASPSPSSGHKESGRDSAPSVGVTFLCAVSGLWGEQTNTSALLRKCLEEAPLGRRRRVKVAAPCGRINPPWQLLCGRQAGWCLVCRLVPTPLSGRWAPLFFFFYGLSRVLRCLCEVEDKVWKFTTGNRTIGKGIYIGLRLFLWSFHHVFPIWKIYTGDKNKKHL